MYLVLAVLISSWTVIVGLKANFGAWDSLILACWLAWPLFLVVILIRARENSSGVSIWKLSARSDFLLLGGLIPLLIAQVVYNLTVSSNIRADATFVDLTFYIGVFSVSMWGVTAVFVALFYAVSRMMGR